MAVSPFADDILVGFVSIRSGIDPTPADQRTPLTPAATRSAALDQAWVAAGGFTAGLRQSFFDFSSGYTYTGNYASQRVTNLIAYQHSIDKTAAVAVSLEDGSLRRYQEGVLASYGAQRFPDVVVRGRWTPSWGAVHAAAALHPINDAITNDRELGYAFNAGLEYRQKWSELFGPAAGETFGRFILTGAYAKGALDYLGIPRFSTDYVADETGKIVPTTGASGLVSYEHVWRPNFKTTASLALYGTRTELMNFEWKTQGLLAQVGAEYLLAPGATIGAQVDWYRDWVRGRYFGLPGEPAEVSFVNAFLYMRRRL
jgi:hypothetical protein